jgi:UDP-glucuronate decarboxylase
MGDEVICLDNLQTGSEENIKHLFSNPNFKFVIGDITDPNIFREVGEVKQIYNLACPASPVHYQMDPVKTVLANTLGVINVLNLARTSNARILQTSTSEVYGDPLVHPQTEDYRGNVNPIGPRACYDEGKRVAETLFFDYHRQYEVEIRVVRIFNTYGPRLAEGDGRVISNFIVQALRGEDLTIFGDGEQTRSLCFVSDTVAGLIKMMNKDDFTGPVNIGNPYEQTIKEIAEKIISLTGSKSKLIYQDLPKDDPKKRKPDITLAKRELGWEPIVVVDEGLNQTIEYFRAK